MMRPRVINRRVPRLEYRDYRLGILAIRRPGGRRIDGTRVAGEGGVGGTAKEAVVGSGDETGGAVVALHLRSSEDF